MHTISKKYSLCLFVAFVMFCALSLYCVIAWTPMICDDYQFQFKLILQPDGTYHPVAELWASFEDFWYAFTHHADWQNARFGNYAFLLVVYAGGIALSSLLNAVVVTALWLVVTSMMCGRLTWTTFTATFIAGLVLLSAPDRVFLWRDACSNYAWGALLFMGLLWLLKDSSRRRLPLVCFFAFLCGAWHEGLAIPLLAALVVYSGGAFLRKKPLDYAKYGCAFVFAFLGFAWLFTSPHFVQHRAAVGMSKCFELTVLAGGVHRMLLFCLPTSVAFVMMLYVYRKRLFDDFLFLFACMNMGAATLVFARGGGWGGGAFYCSFAVLLCAMRALAPYLLKRGRLFACVQVALVSVMLVVFMVRVYDVHRVYNGIMAREIQEPTLRCDYFRDGIEVPWILKSAFYFMEHPTDFAGPCYGKPPFTVVFNQKLTDDAVYGQFESYSQDEAVWLKTDKHSIVRLPQGYRPVYKQFAKEKSNQALKEGRTLILHSSLMSEWVSRTALTLLRKPHVIEYYSYHKGYHYIVLPVEVNDMDYLEIEIERQGKRKWLKVSHAD